MCMQALDLYSSSMSGRKPISSYMLIPCIFALASTKGKSKLSPLYVAMTVGLDSRMCSNHRLINPGYSSQSINIISASPTSSGSLKTVNSP